MRKQDLDAMANAILEDMGIGFPPTRFASLDEIGAQIGMSADDVRFLVEWVLDAVRKMPTNYHPPIAALMGVLLGWKLAKGDELRKATA